MFEGCDDYEVVNILKDNPEVAVVAMRNANTDSGYMIEFLDIKNISDLKYAREIDARVVSYADALDMSDLINEATSNSTLWKVWAWLANLNKVVALVKPMTAVRNAIDAYVKGTIETGDPFGYTANLIKAHNLIKEYKELNKRIIEDRGIFHATEKDKLCSNNKKGGQSCTSTINNGNTIIIYDSNATPAPQNKPTNAKEMHYYENPAGCYNSANIDLNSNDGDDTKNRLYRSTISFPGAWINFKTGEITYKPVTDVEHWQSIEDKFCIPREAKDVNTKYWLYYQGKRICNKTQSSINKSDIEKWNIRANIIGFGLYNWNINVKCFYALDEKDNKCTDDVEYRIRSINLDDMFPNQEGEARNATNSTGRDPGFNWSSAATIPSSKNAYYNSNPSTLINKIQNVGYGIYSDKYLDYEFNLDTNTLREMRNQINNGNYTDFDESGFHKSERAGIGYYYSERIRNLGNKNKTPDKSIVDLVCNNLQLDEAGNYLDNCGVTNGESE